MVNGQQFISRRGLKPVTFGSDSQVTSYLSQMVSDPYKMIEERVSRIYLQKIKHLYVDKYVHDKT